MLKHPLLAWLAAVGALVATASCAQARERACASAERAFAGGVLGVALSREAPEQPIQTVVVMSLGASDAPLRLRAFYETKGGRLATPYWLIALMPVADLHAPVRSTYEQVVIKATGGTTWRSEPRALPLPHVSFSGEIPRTFNEVLATTRPTDTARNADLLARLAKGEALAITRQGDGGEVFSTLSATPPSTVARDRLLASALAEATSKLAPCQPGPPLSIPPVREREPWPFLYLRPEDASVLADAPTLDEVVKVTPAWGGGAVEGHTLLDCTRDEYDRLACRAERSQPAWVGQISVPIANRITLAERLPDGRRTAGLALLLSMTWDKDAIRYAIAPPTGPAIPPPTPNAAPAP